MKIFYVSYSSPRSEGTDTVVCEDKPEVNECMEERYGKEVTINFCIEISIHKARIKDLTVGDFLKLIK